MRQVAGLRKGPWRDWRRLKRVAVGPLWLVCQAFCYNWGRSLIYCSGGCSVRNQIVSLFKNIPGCFFSSGVHTLVGILLLGARL